MGLPGGREPVEAPCPRVLLTGFVLEFLEGVNRLTLYLPRNFSGRLPIQFNAARSFAMRFIRSEAFAFFTDWD
jgi:hypothetical protein